MVNMFLLMIEFFKIGLFAIGGGLATIPFLQELATKYGWFDASSLSTMIAISESTPGPIGVNMATYVGYHIFHVIGGLLATFSLVCPSVIIVCWIAKYMKQLANHPQIQYVFLGIRPLVVGLILSVCVDLFFSTFIESSSQIDVLAVTLFVFGLLLYRKIKCHPIVIICLGAIAGILFYS